MFELKRLVSQENKKAAILIDFHTTVLYSYKETTARINIKLE